MNENIAAREVEVEALEVLDLGDATQETKQPHPIQQIKDSAVTWTFWGSEE